MRKMLTTGVDVFDSLKKLQVPLSDVGKFDIFSSVDRDFSAEIKV